MSNPTYEHVVQRAIRMFWKAAASEGFPYPDWSDITPGERAEWFTLAKVKTADELAGLSYNEDEDDELELAIDQQKAKL